MSRAPVTRCLAVALALALGAAVLWQISVITASAAAPRQPERHDQLTWAPCNANARSSRPSTCHPLSDAAAAALITPESETRPDNGRSYSLDGHVEPPVNDYVPSAGQIAAFRSSRGSTGQSNVTCNPYYADVDGRDGLRHPSTDDLIQWAAHKWGIPEDWLRAEYVHESYWNQFMIGDDTVVSRAAYPRYPAQSRLPGGMSAYQSLGITQIRWVPGNSLHWGTEPLRWLSTAFNVDYQAATLRFYYDDPQGRRTEWGDKSYRPCERWSSVGGWYRPYPWNTAAQASYANSVRQILAGRDWTSQSFRRWTPPSLPPGIHLFHRSA